MDDYLNMMQAMSASAQRAAIWDGDGYEFATTQYKGPGIPISGDDYPRPDARLGWEMVGNPSRAGDIILWRRRKNRTNP